MTLLTLLTFLIHLMLLLKKLEVLLVKEPNYCVHELIPYKSNNTHEHNCLETINILRDSLRRLRLLDKHSPLHPFEWDNNVKKSVCVNYNVKSKHFVANTICHTNNKIYLQTYNMNTHDKTFTEAVFP